MLFYFLTVVLPFDVFPSDFACPVVSVVPLLLVAFVEEGAAAAALVLVFVVAFARASLVLVVVCTEDVLDVVCFAGAVFVVATAPIHDVMITIVHIATMANIVLRFMTIPFY